MAAIVDIAQATSSNAPTVNAQASIDFSQARLSITKQAITTHSPVSVGDTVQYIITVTNIGSEPALNVVVTDNAPNHILFTSASTNIGAITILTPTLVVATIGTLNPGQTATINIGSTVI